MAKILLTDAAVKKYRAGNKRREIADNTPGLYLVIQPSGAKSWALRFRRPDGRPAKLVLGPLDFSGKEPEGDPIIGAPLTLASARALAAEQHRQRKRGVDVAARHVSEKRRAKQAASTATANSFAALAIQFIAEHKVKKTSERPRRWNDSARMLGLDYPKDGSEPSMIKSGLAQRWADKPVSSITGDDLHDLVEEARLRGIPGLERRRASASNTQGRAMAAVLSVFFSWAKEHRHINVNPAVDIYKPNAPKARDRVLNAKLDMRRADEVRWFWSACDCLHEPFDTILKLSLLTGCRLNEIARLRADEVSDDLTTLRIPGERTKNHLPHDVYLPLLARDLLAGVRRIDGAKFVFTTTGSSPVSGWSKTKRNLDAAMLALAREERKDAEIKPWRLHDLRRSAATGMAGIGIAPHIIEACLNHVSGAKAGVAGTYNRETYEPEKRVAWQRWALHIESIVAGTDETNIVPMRERVQ